MQFPKHLDLLAASTVAFSTCYALRSLTNDRVVSALVCTLLLLESCNYLQHRMHQGFLAFLQRKHRRRPHAVTALLLCLLLENNEEVDTESKQTTDTQEPHEVAPEEDNLNGQVQLPCNAAHGSQPAVPVN